MCALLDVMASEEDDAQWAGAVDEAVTGMAAPRDGVPAGGGPLEEPPAAALSGMTELLRLSQVPSVLSRPM